MNERKSNPVIENVRRALGRPPGDPVDRRPDILPARTPGSPENEIERLFREIQALSGTALRVRETELGEAFRQLVETEGVRKASLWPTGQLRRWQAAEHLQAAGAEIVPPEAGKHALAACDLGVTEADFALPETGTLGLFSAPEKPRAVSLLPRVHLVLLRPQALRSDLQQVFTEARPQHYLILITGPSRTADIELTTTLGVHGPKALYVWLVE